MIPIACTLSPVGAADQLAEWRALLAPAARGVRLEDTRLTVDLDPSRLDANVLLDLARREQACCRFLSFTVEITGAWTHLVVDGPPDAAGVLRGFASLARSAGVGAQ